MSHYKNLQNNTSWTTVRTTQHLETLIYSNYNCTNMLELHDSLTELLNEGFSYFEIKLDISDNGYCHWIHTVFASDRPGIDKLSYWDIDKIISPLSDIQYMKEGRG